MSPSLPPSCANAFLSMGPAANAPYVAPAARIPFIRNELRSMASNSICSSSGAALCRVSHCFESPFLIRAATGRGTAGRVEDGLGSAGTANAPSGVGSSPINVLRSAAWRASTVWIARAAARMSGFSMFAAWPR